MSTFNLSQRFNTAYDKAYRTDPNPGPGSYENETDKFGLGSTCVLQGPKSDTSFRDFSSSFGTSQRSSLVTGGPIDAREVFDLAPTQYHIPTRFDDIVAASSFAASTRRRNASNKGLHSHYTTVSFMNEQTEQSEQKGSQRLPRIPGIETKGGTSMLAMSLTGGLNPASGAGHSQKRVVYMREKQRAVANRRPGHMR